MKYILTERQLNFLKEQFDMGDIDKTNANAGGKSNTILQQAYQLMIDGAGGPGTNAGFIVNGINMLKTKEDFYALNDLFKDKKTGYNSFDKMIKGEFTFSPPFSNLDDMKKITTKLEQLGVSFGYGPNNRYRDFTIAPKPAPVASGSATPPPPKAENWNKVKNYLLTNGFPPDFVNKGVENEKDVKFGESVEIKNQKYQIEFRQNGDVEIWYVKGDGYSITKKWSWDGSKPVIEGGYQFEVTRKPSGYGTTVEDITTGNKILGLGSRGDLVKLIQYDLVTEFGASSEIGCKTDPQSEQDCDGIYGEKTKKAVRDFQKSTGARSTEGNVGKETLALLGRS